MDAVSTRLIHGEGTPESAWQAWFAQYKPPTHDLGTVLRPGGALHVVAPHPDDEILSCAGILQQAARLGTAIHVWAVTDGEASHPGSRRWPPDQLARIRTQESEQALRVLSVPARRHRLGMADGGIQARQGELADQLANALAPSDTVITPWRLDGHPDHEAVAHASLQAAAARACQCLEAPIWGWHWADPARGDMPADRAIRIPMIAQDHRAKARAIQAFQSQLQADPETGHPPILPAFALARMQRPFEVLLR